MLREGTIQLPDFDDVLAADLVNLRIDNPTSKGQLKLEAKERTKDRLGKSPDRGDALALTMFDGPRNLPVTDDIGNLDGTNSTDEFMEQTENIKEVNQRTSDIVKKAFDLSSMPQVYCPTCFCPNGMVWLDADGEMTNRQDAVSFRCLICRKQGGVEECLAQLVAT
jgi:hypothetical protein